jgi:hypothetical protein
MVLYTSWQGMMTSSNGNTNIKSPLLRLFGGVQILGRRFNPTSGVKVTLFEELEDTGELN